MSIFPRAGVPVKQSLKERVDQLERHVYQLHDKLWEKQNTTIPFSLGSNVSVEVLLRKLAKNADITIDADAE